MEAAPQPAPSEPYRVVGRYAIYREIASGGMATVYFGRLLGPVGFARTVAIKRLHPHFAKDPEFVSMFLDEARLVARIRHPNVVQTLDVVATAGELLIVMDYIQGEALWRLARATLAAGGRIPPRVVTAIMTGVLYGLHAAHEARGERGEPLGIVHRDVSPQNILVGVDGTARVLDFGVAKAAGRIHSTQGTAIKGKLAYMAPEQLEGHVTRQSDIFAASIVLWEMLAMERLFAAEDERATVGKLLGRVVPPPSQLMGDNSASDVATRLRLADLDKVVLKGLSRDPTERFATAREMGIALEQAFGVASLAEVGDWVEKTAKDALFDRSSTVAVIESSSSNLTPLEAADLGVAIAAAASGPDVLAGEPTMSQASAAVADDVPSQLSKVSLSREPPMSHRPGRARIAVLAAAGVAVLGLVGLGSVILRPQAPSDARPTSAASATFAAASPAASPAPVPDEPKAPATSTVSDPSASPSASAVPSAVAVPPKRPWAGPARPGPSPAKGTNVDSVIDTRK